MMPPDSGLKEIARKLISIIETPVATLFSNFLKIPWKNCLPEIKKPRATIGAGPPGDLQNVKVGLSLQELN